jgi:Uma2 family endonuclease
MRPQTDLTYDDLQRMFPDVDNVRRELIEGELIVTASPWVRHQEVVGAFVVALAGYADENGGEALLGPIDVFFSDINVVEPDVLFVTADHLDRVEEKFVRSAPDIVVEISSPSTRRLELVRKRDLYERYGVPEYWYVDLDADRVEVYRLAMGVYGSPELLTRADRLRSDILPGFSAGVADLLGKPDDDLKRSE